MPRDPKLEIPTTGPGRTADILSALERQAAQNGYSFPSGSAKQIARVTDALGTKPVAGLAGRDLIVTANGFRWFDQGGIWVQGAIPNADPAGLGPVSYPHWLVGFGGKLYFSNGATWKQIA